MNSPEQPQSRRETPAYIVIYRDLFGIAGTVLTGYGAWLHYPPLGFAVGGGLMVALTIAGTIRDRG
jgi:hypothetical protein